MITALIELWLILIKICLLPITIPIKIYTKIRDARVKRKERELINKAYKEEIEKDSKF